MTATGPNDEEFIRQLLDESGVGASLPLQTALLDLRAAASAAPPAPAGALAAFMAPAVVPLRPRRRAMRGTLIGLAIAAATGLGASGVAAANPGFHSAVGQAVGHVIEAFHPAAGGTSPAPGPEKAPAGVLPGSGGPARPSPAETGMADTPTPDADRSSPGPERTSTVPASGTGSRQPTVPPGQETAAPGHQRNVLPAPDLPVPDLPVPTGLPSQGGGRPGGATLPVPAVPHRTAPAPVPDLPDLPVLPGGDPKQH